jgi:rhodanese-related sulfurtransferase
MIDDDRAVTIVDVREPELFRAGHIPGAINIPYEVSHARILKELNPKERIVFVCHGGPMGDELSRILIKNSYKEVFNLKGGMQRGWKSERIKSVPEK